MGRETQTHRAGCQAEMEAETGAMRLQAQECHHPRKLEEAQKYSPHGCLRDHGPADPEFGLLAPRTMREYSSVASRHQCGVLGYRALGKQLLSHVLPGTADTVVNLVACSPFSPNRA